MPEVVMMNGIQYLKTESSIDHGKDGITHVTVYDPCITERQKLRRREHLKSVCEDMIRRGLA